METLHQNLLKPTRSKMLVEGKQNGLFYLSLYVMSVELPHVHFSSRAHPRVLPGTD